MVAVDDSESKKSSQYLIRTLMCLIQHRQLATEHHFGSRVLLPAPDGPISNTLRVGKASSEAMRKVMKPAVESTS